ncbi:hypothetical protein, partial [Klebsiella pneumoniae]|uniref:hypothetical protein n=1 Tax=Klebsiella pneumoniae TaxID=573 RepID=UPI003D36DC8A
IWKAGCENKLAQTGSARLYNYTGALTSHLNNREGYVSATQYKHRMRWFMKFDQRGKHVCFRAGSAFVVL